MKSPDTLVIGAGVLGCWAARHAISSGEQVLLLESRHVGAGASGGFLGALMPHMPDSWNPKKQFQYEGLTSLDTVVEALEDETGIDCGYRRCGRVMPVTNAKLVQQIQRRVDGAGKYWDERYTLSFREDETAFINPSVASQGVQADTLSARINPRNYMKALEASIRAHCMIMEGAEAELIRSVGDGFEVELSDGTTLSAGKVIVANGYEAYPLLHPFMDEMNSGKPLGRGVKGQAMLVEHEHDDTMPVLYHDGTYIVPHAGNRVAIGSTSVNDWEGQGAHHFDEADLGFYDKAIEMMPSLRDAPVIERWAAVRPRNTMEGRGTEPFFGPIPGQEGLYALIGGFKITLGIAHIASRGFL